MPPLTSTIVSVTRSTVSLIRWSIGDRSNGSRLCIVPPAGTICGLIGARIDLHELVADQAVGLNRRHRVDANERMQILADAQLHAETSPTGLGGT